jgi:hypothetical protein
MTESRLWQLFSALLAALEPEADATRHEDRMCIGTPDISFAIRRIGGWCELKAYEAWPKRSTTPLAFRNLKPWQRNWIESRGRAGAPVTVLVAVADEFLLLSWVHIRKLGKLTRGELYEIALWRSRKRLDAGLIDALVRPAPPEKRRLRRTG